MHRDLRAFTESIYDILVIGGGIYGACVAREAALRGLSVALVEKVDFGSATSANSLKIIHGGLRYLQHGDFQRMRASICERRTLMQIAPHLIHPLPVLMPTYSHGLHGKEIFSLALKINDLVGFDRNRHSDPQKHLPRGRVISKRECLRLLPGLRQEELTGGAIFYDAQVYNSERFLLACLQSAAQAGATLANYAEVIGFLTDQAHVTGVQVRDILGEEQFDIRAKVVVNTAGPWVDQVLGLLKGLPTRTHTRFAKAINLVTRSLGSPYAVGLPSWQDYRDTDALLNKGSRFLFITPWRGRSIIGTAYSVSDLGPERLTVTPHDIQKLLTDINCSYPAAGLKPHEISFVHAGLVPIAGVYSGTGDIQLAKHPQLLDHRQTGWQGLISVVGVKYTTARHVAQRVIDHVFAIWGQRPPRSISAVTPLYGGQIERFDAFLQTAIGKRPYGLGAETVRHLIYNYGAAYPEVLRYMASRDGNDEQCAVLSAEIQYGIEAEMAQKLADIIFRRTELGTIGHPGRLRLRLCAEVMGARLGWDEATIQRELQEVEQQFPRPVA
jgi:glycerol-3-phosphate dehydrogenase